MSALRASATHLADVLEQENAALRRLDLAAATTLLEAKRAALLGFEATGRSAADRGLTDPATDDVGRRLVSAAAENKRLLERAMRAQQHVMSLLAQAARQSRPCGRYGARGAYATPRAEDTFALSANA